MVGGSSQGSLFFRAAICIEVFSTPMVFRTFVCAMFFKFAVVMGPVEGCRTSKWEKFFRTIVLLNSGFTNDLLW
jgi:hypothetical protein